MPSGEKDPIVNREDSANPPRPPALKAVPLKPEPSPKPPRKGGMHWIWWLVLAIVVFGGFRYYQSVSQKRQAAVSPSTAGQQGGGPVSVAAAPVTVGNLPIVLTGLGTVTAYNTDNIKSRVDGPIVKVNFTEGQNVKQGEVLLQIDPRPFQVALEQAQGQQARDQAQLKDAQTNLARYQTLWQEGVIPKQQLDTQSAQVAQFQGTLETDQGAIDNAKLQLSFTNIAAPISGRIGLRQVDVGNIVHASDPNALAVITQIKPIAVLFTLPADSLRAVMAKLQAGVKLPVDAYDRTDQNKISSGSLETVDNEIDVNTGTSRLKAIFSNDDGALFPNQFVNCRLLLDTKKGVLLVLAAAVQRGPQGSFVYLIKPDETVRVRPITTGTARGGQIEVTSGLAVGDQVVTDGQDKLQEGSRVQIRSDSPVAPPAP